MLAAEFGTGQVLWSIVWFTMFFIWIMLLFQVFGDIFRSPDLSGVAKAMWSLFVIVFPYLGVFAYLVARGGHMHEHAVAQAQAQEAATREYIRSAAQAEPSTSDELAKLATLRDNGTIDDREFATAKAALLGV
jgi:hypothetical protein